VPLSEAVEGQLLTSLLTQQLANNNAATAANPQQHHDQQQQLAGPSSVPTPGPNPQSASHSSSNGGQGDMMMMPPVAIRGCFQLLLAVAAPRAADSSFSMSIRQLVSQLGLTGNKRSPKQIGVGSSSGSSMAGICDGGDATGGSSSSNVQLALQVNSQGPVVVARQGDGAWKVAGTAAAGATAGNAGAAADSDQFVASMGCWMQPPCIKLAASAAAAASSSSSGAATAQVAVHGLPAAAAPAVRVLLVQGAAVVADQVVQLQQQQAAGASVGLTAR
jgi:hypothetical protein